MGTGANATAVAYVELRLADGATLFGVGIDKNIVVASLKAVLSGVNRVLKQSPAARGAVAVSSVAAAESAALSRVAAVLKRGHGLELPPKLEAEFARMIDSIPGRCIRRADLADIRDGISQCHRRLRLRGARKPD